MAKAETVRTGNLGKKQLRLARMDGRYFGLADGKICCEGDDADDVWRRLHDQAGKSDPRYFGYSGARARFLRFFPDGFHSNGFAGQERDYKLAAKQKLDDSVPLEEAVTGSGHGEAILAIYRATNMLYPLEKSRLQEILRGQSADEYVRAAARFAQDPDKGSLLEMERILKPEVTKDFARRVGHRFAEEYEPRLHFPVYESLLDLVDRTFAELGELKPRDRIDIQSFIWVVGDYREDRDEIY